MTNYPGLMVTWLLGFVQPYIKDSSNPDFS